MANTSPTWPPSRPTWRTLVQHGHQGVQHGDHEANMVIMGLTWLQGVWYCKKESNMAIRHPFRHGHQDSNMCRGCFNWVSMPGSSLGSDRVSEFSTRLSWNSAHHKCRAAPIVSACSLTQECSGSSYGQRLHWLPVGWLGWMKPEVRLY